MNDDLVSLLRRLIKGVSTQDAGYGQQEATGVDLDLVEELEEYLDKHHPEPKTWRDDPPSEAQLSVIRKWRNGCQMPLTKGEATDMITARIETAQRMKDLRESNMGIDDDGDDSWRIGYDFHHSRGE